MGVVEGNLQATDNDWEEITKGGDDAIRIWIDDQLAGKSCNIVLIGENTAGRKWIKYEIENAWNSGKGLLGIYIHGLKNFSGAQSLKGRNPFDDFTMNRDQAKLSSIVKTYNPPTPTARKRIRTSAIIFPTGSKTQSPFAPITKRFSLLDTL